jgi:hypothetical protein
VRKTVIKAVRYASNPAMTAQLTYVKRVEISLGKMRRYSSTIEILVKTTTT